MISTKYIGMDVHKESISAAVMNSADRATICRVAQTSNNLRW
jgi:hypothetical protein